MIDQNLKKETGIFNVKCVFLVREREVGENERGKEREREYE